MKEMTVVRVEWGRGFYKDGKLVDYHQGKWGEMSPQKTIELYLDCKVTDIDMSGAAWEFSGDGFPESLEDALNTDFDPFAETAT